MPADVFAHRHQAAPRVPEPAAWTARVSSPSGVRPASDATACETSSAAKRADAVTRGTGRVASNRLAMPHRPHPRDRRGDDDAPRAARAAMPQLHAQLDAVGVIDEIEHLDLRRVGDEAFGDAEAEREVLQVARRGQQHGMGRAVVAQGDGGFLGEAARAVAAQAAFPNRTRRALAGTGRGFRHDGSPPVNRPSARPWSRRRQEGASRSTGTGRRRPRRPSTPHLRTSPARRTR